MLKHAGLIGICLSLFCCGLKPPTIPPVQPQPAPQSHYLSPQKGLDGVIVFVHGVFGNADKTWHNDESGADWPTLVAKDVDFLSDEVYVVSYYTPHFRHAANIEETAQEVLQHLYDDGVLQHKRIYFVTHSMGGLIVKRILNMLDKPSRIADLRRIRAVLLISTPSQGAKVADIGSWISLNPQLKDMKPIDFNTFLLSLENDYLYMLRERNRSHEDYPQVFCAYETLPTHKIRIVSRVYVSTSCDNVPFPMNYDHAGIVKPPDVNTDPYPWAKARLREADSLRAP